MRYHNEQKMLRLLGLLAPALFVAAMSWGFLLYSWQQSREAGTSYEEKYYEAEAELETGAEAEAEVGPDAGRYTSADPVAEAAAEAAVDPIPAAPAISSLEDENQAQDIQKLHVQEAHETNWLSGTFDPPVFWWQGRQIQRGYGLSYSATYKDYRFHSGLDFGAGLSEEVLASAPGIVKEVTLSKEKNYLVVLQHADDWESIYSHLGSVAVAEGEAVGLGQILGLVGRPGSEEQGEEPHVHWELWQGDNRKNPTDFMP